MNHLSDNIDDDLKTTNPNAYHWREMYLRQVELYNIMVKSKEEKLEKLLAEKDKRLAEKDERLSKQDNLILALLKKSD